MSYKDFVDIRIQLNKGQFEVGDRISGKIHVKNNSPVLLKLENIKLKLILKHRGRGETDVIELGHFLIHQFKTIAKGATISADFEFDPIYNVSYNGKNISQAIVIKTKVDIAKESEKMLRDEKLSGFKIGGYLRGVFRPDFYDEKIVAVVRGKRNYQINSAKGVLRPGLKVALIVMVVTLILSIILGANMNKISQVPEYQYIAPGFFVLMLIIIYFWKISPSLAIGKIGYELKNLEGNFYEVNLNFEKRSEVLQSIIYQIIAVEKVTYDNGSSRSTATHTFYKGPEKTIVAKGRKLVHQAELPNRSLPVSIDNGDFEVNWYFKITAETKSNMTLKSRGEIFVGYEKEKDS